MKLEKIMQRISIEDRMRVKNIRYHPKYKPGFEKEVRTETFWNEPAYRNMLVERRTGRY